MTAAQLLSSSLRLVGVLAAGEQMAPEDAEDAMAVFGDMVDSWNADRSSIFTTGSNDFPFVFGKQAYTLGVGGDFAMARPPNIDGMSTILLSDPTNPVEIPLALYTVQQWQEQLPVKQVNGTFPLLCYDDGGFPLRTLNFWPIPQDQPSLCRIYGWQPLSAPASYATPITFPPGYAEAFRYNLAIRLQAEFAPEKQLSPLVQQIAVESLGRVKTMNAPVLQLRSDLVLDPDNYNWKADMFGIPW